MKGWIKYGLFALTILLLVIWVGGFVGKKISPQQITREVKEVDNLVVGKVEVLEEVESAYVGQIVADKRIELSSRLSGRIKEIYVKEGDFVRAGKLLIRLDAEDIEAQVTAVDYQTLQAEQALKSAQANYEAIKKTFERYSTLHKEGAITQQEYDQILAQYESAKAQVEQAKAGIRAIQQQRKAIASNLKYALLTAPFSGYVATKFAEPGDLALPGKPLLVLEAPPFLLEVFLPEKMIGKINVGQIYKVYVPSINRLINSTVVEISPSLDQKTKTFRVKLKLHDTTDIKSGMFANLLIPEKLRVLLIPESALVKRYDFTGVWTVKEDNTLELRYIRLGDKRGDKYEVLAGLEGKEEIIVKGVERACEGCRIRR